MGDEASRTSLRIRRVLQAAWLMLLAIPCFYLLGALAGAIVPRNPDGKEPLQGILVFVRSNGAHVDLVLPASAVGHELYRWVPPEHVANPESASGWIAFGWGQREFYLETPRWSDLTARNAIRAIFGGDAVMHVEHVGRPRPSGDARPLLLELEAYSRLVAYIRNSFAVHADGPAAPIVGKGYGSNDVFYDAGGHYSASRTSNQWASNALAAAGVKIGVWTPFAQGVMWRFQNHVSSPQGRTDTCSDMRARSLRHPSSMTETSDS